MGTAVDLLLIAIALPFQPAVQQGDAPGEPQPPLPADLAIPAAPALSPGDELATFVLEDGFTAELVAAEPLVRDPVQVAWDERGRLFVVEMSGYMPTIDGEGEREPVGTIALLTDTDGDGRMDARSEFLSGLVLPRAVAAARGGALVLAPPELLFCRDTDDDGVADEVEVVDTGLGGLDSPEHAVNGLVWGQDGAYHTARADWSWRFALDARGRGRWLREPTAGGGQWGVSMDDLGRVFFDTNSAALYADFYPSRYAIRNPNHGRASGVAVHLTAGSAPRPIRMNPGVNRGYRERTLGDDWRLREYTAACAPWIYRGDAYPASHRGDAFVCEPAGNLVKRFELSDEGLGVRAEETAGPEFMASTDERFRPVSLADGPDGNLYVVDMYRGVIQHRIFVTSWLRAQVVERGLEQPLGRGRIWRVVHDEGRGAPGPDLAEATWTQLTETLAHPSGWWRDQAHRLIVEEGGPLEAELPVAGGPLSEGSSAEGAMPEGPGRAFVPGWDPDAAELLRAVSCKCADPLARVHATQALAQLGALELADLFEPLRDPDPRVRTVGVHLSEPWLASAPADDPEQTFGRLVLLLRALAHGGDARLRHQVLLSLGEAARPQTDALMLELLAQDASTPEARSAVLSGLYGREAEFLDLLLDDLDWRESVEGRADFVRLLARAVVREGRAERIAGLVEWAARKLPGPGWQLDALVRGVAEGRPRAADGGPGWIRLPAQPDAARRLESEDRAAPLLDALAWPGKPGTEAAEVRALTAGERARFERGRAIYAEVCAACHLGDGRGGPALAPPLRGSQWVLGDERRLLRVLRNGLEGPIEVAGERWELEMPALGAGAEDLAAIATYVRREWGHAAGPVDPAAVRSLLEAEQRERPWTAAELEVAD